MTKRRGEIHPRPSPSARPTQILEFVNAHAIAQGLSAFAPERAAIKAGRVMIERLEDLARQGEDFAFETTLASRSYLKRLIDLQERGYYIHLIFLYLNSVELAIQRVAERVRAGGHDIPEATIRRRYDRGKDNFFSLFRDTTDSWQLYNVSGELPIEVAYGDKLAGETIVNEILWRMIQKQKIRRTLFLPNIGRR